MGSGFLPVSTFSGPIFASLCLVPIVSEFSPKTALTAYLGISLLALFFVPDREVSLFFTLLTGYYPVLQPQLAHISKKWLRLACKFGLLVVAVSVYFAILLFLLSIYIGVCQSRHSSQR